MAYDSDALIPSSEYYRNFVEAYKIKLSFFEKLCKMSYRILKISAPNFVKKNIEDPIYLSDMKVSENEVWSLTISSLLLSLLVFIPISILNFPTSIIFLIFPFFIAYNVISYPAFHSEVIRVRAGNETVSIILYMVTYLSLNPVYEKAVQFAASRCHGPLGNDLKKVVWDINVGKFSTIKNALATYSRKWTLWNEEFVNSLIMLQLIEVQTTLEGRDETLKRATEGIMTSTCNKMEDYAYKLKTPSMLLMLFGIFMPLITLVMFPLIGIFLSSSKLVDPVYLAIGYDVLLPFFMWWILYRMISKRPATYSTSEKLEEVEPNKYIRIKKLGIRLPIIPVAILLGFLIAIPGLMYFSDLISAHSHIFSQYSNKILAQNAWGEYSIERYGREYILGDTFKAMFVIWGAAAGIIFATYFRSKGPYDYDQYVRKLESDFTSALYGLQTALHENIPIESAIGKVIEGYKKLGKENSMIATFFSDLYDKISRFSISIKEALFGKDGLIEKLPSSLIKNIMEIVTSALNKGSVIASRVVKNIAYYLLRLEDIEHTIKKGMQDIISNLLMQGGFIAPAISAIVASSAVIIIQMLQAVARAMQSIEKMYSFGTDVGGTMSKTLGLIDFKSVMPPTVMELIAGVYLIEIVVIICIFVTGIERGFNKVPRDRRISNTLSIAIILFTVVFFIMVLIFQPILGRIQIS